MKKGNYSWSPKVVGQGAVAWSEGRESFFSAWPLRKCPAVERERAVGETPRGGSAGAGWQCGRRDVNGDDEGKDLSTMREVNLLTQAGSLPALRSVRCHDKFHLPYFTAGTL